ncbi:MAG: helicase HerA-like domain-containing protein [Thermoplasmata archaeon]|nr:ATP-binding protein [Thermoplasmata archaeon]
MEEMNKVGIVYGDVSTTEVQVTITGLIDQGEYVQIFHQNSGWVLGRLDRLERKTDLSVEKALLINAGEAVPIQEVLLGYVSIIGYRDNKGILQVPKTPFRAGEPVYKAKDSLIKETIGLENIEGNGAYIGLLYNHMIPIYLDINALVQKHVSILAKTGGGKSYLTGVIIEELIKHNVTTVVIDPHGEYVSLKYPAQSSKSMEKFNVKPKGYPEKIIEFSPDTKTNRNAKPLKFTLSQITPRELLNLINFTDFRAYLVPLRKAMDYLKAAKGNFFLKDLINILSQDEDSATVNALINALSILDDEGIFSDVGTKIDEIVQNGKVSIINLKGVSPDIQEMVVQRLSYMLFELRKRDALPPLMFVVEEAHNFIPQQGKAMSSKILRTIASEGRKFGLGLCIISQRPAKVDKNILSQCNTQIILKVTNPNDLKTIGDSVEGLTRSSIDEIQNLPVGVALVTGASLAMPLFVEVRPRETKHGGESVNVAGSK